MKLIKAIFNFSVPICIVFSLSSCCHQKDCLSIEDINEIQLFNFDSTEVDSIFIKTYVKNTIFTVFIDSFLTSAHGRTYGDPDLIIFMPEKLNIMLDYEIEIIGSNMTYFVTDFSPKEQQCNSCFPFGHEYGDVLDSYFVNGQNQISEVLQILK